MVQKMRRPQLGNSQLKRTGKKLLRNQNRRDWMNTFIDSLCQLRRLLVDGCHLAVCIDIWRHLDSFFLAWRILHNLIERQLAGMNTLL